MIGHAKRLLALLPALLAASPGLAATPERDAKLYDAVEACVPDARKLLEQLVSIDSGTGDADGLGKVGAIYAGQLRTLGATVRMSPPTAPELGDNVVATLTGTGKGRILLIAHMDTVFSRGTVAKQPPRWVGDHLIGPGAGDDKGGGVTAICALRALAARGIRDYARIDLILNASEETGSHGSRDLIQTLARASDVAINLERGVPADKVIVARKGSAVLTFDFTGRAAHSGLEPQNGRNAALEAARVAQLLGALADPARETTVTVTILNGGDKINVVPDRATIKADVRAYSKAEFDRVEQGAAAIAAKPAIDGVTIASRLDRNFPAWPRAASTDALLDRANRLYGELGRTLTAVAVGSSADVALAAETGTPSIDGFGMEGGGAHGPDDYADIATLPQRTYLLARMLTDLGRNPPAK
jgi:glutamate carboxypeptidase